MNRELVWRMVTRITAPLARRVRLTVARAVVQLVDDATKLQSVQIQIYDDQIRDGVEHFQPGGISHVPSAGAEGIMLSVGGDTSHGLLVNASNRDQRPTEMNEGETQVWDKTGSKVHLKSDGDVAMVPSGSFVHVGGDPAEAPIARADLVDARLAAVETQHNLLSAAFNLAVGVFNVHPHALSSQVVTGSETVTATAPAASQVLDISNAAGSSVAASIGKVT